MRVIPASPLSIFLNSQQWLLWSWWLVQTLGYVFYRARVWLHLAAVAEEDEVSYRSWVLFDRSSDMGGVFVDGVVVQWYILTARVDSSILV